MSEGGAAGCALCGRKAPLKRSHIIPRFVSRALKVPDGPTRSLLCGECEDRFGTYESTFARVIFHPLVTNGGVIAKYDKWLLQFSASVCWRVLEDTLAPEPPAALRAQWATPIATCRETWRQFLMGRTPDTAEHAIHFVPMDSTDRKPAMAGRVVAQGQEAFVCVQLGPVALLGMVADPHASSWRGTQVHRQGKFKARERSIPQPYRDHLFS